MNPIRSFALALCMAATLTLSAQIVEGNLSSVGEAIQVAWAQNPDLEVYQLKQQKAVSEWRIAQGTYLPQVTANANGQWNAALAITPFPAELGVLLGEPGESVNVQFGQPYAYNAGINISQNIFDWQVIQRTRLSKAAIHTAGAQSDAFRQNLAEQVALSYFTSLVAKEALQVSKKDLQIADSILLLAQEKYNQGLIDRYSLNQAKINVNNLKLSESSTQILYQQNLQQLKLLLGVDNEEDLFITQTPDIENLSLDPGLKQDQNLRTLEQQVLQANLQVGVQQSAYSPKLSLYSYLGTQQFQEEFTLSFSEGSWSNYSYLGLNLSIPIFSGGITHNQIKTAQIDLDIAQAQLESETLRSKAKDELLMEEYQQGLISARAAWRNFLLTEENSQLSLQKYQQGVISLDAYFRTFDEYLKAENAYLNSLSVLYTYYATIISRN